MVTFVRTNLSQSGGVKNATYARVRVKKNLRKFFPRSKTGHFCAQLRVAGAPDKVSGRRSGVADLRPDTLSSSIAGNENGFLVEGGGL